MDAIRIGVKGDRQAGLRFDEFPDALREGLREEIDSLTNELYGRIRAATPSKTGDLRDKERVRLFNDKDRITGYVDIAGKKGSQDFAKAGALEYGARRTKKVNEHKMRLDHYWHDKLDAPRMVIVKAFDRRNNQAEHSFLRGPLGAMQPEILRRLNSVVENAVQEANQ